MQYTLNNLYTNNTLDILNGSLEIWFTNNTRNQLNMHDWNNVTGVKPITRTPFLQYFGLWPFLGSSLPSTEQLVEMARWSTSAIMAVRQGRNRYKWFLCATNQIKKIQLTFCGLRDVAAIRSLNDSHHKREKKRTTASTVLARHEAKLLNASSCHQIGLL